MKITENLNDVVKDANGLSLAVSIVVAIAIGFFGGKFLYDLTGFIILFWGFLFIGVAAAGLNIYRAIKAQQKDVKELENDPKYKAYKDVLDAQKNTEDEDVGSKYFEDEWDKEDKKWNED